MSIQLIEQRSAAVATLQQRCPQLNAERVVASLNDGLNLLRDVCFDRIGDDVEEHGLLDSMLMPSGAAAQVRTALGVHTLMDVYSCVEAAHEAALPIGGDADGWLLPWLLQLRFGPADDVAVRECLALFDHRDDEHRRKAFASALERRMPQATKAPLVLYRLYPLAVRACVAIAWGDHWRARELRSAQIKLLPFIADCHACHGQPLDNGETCAHCGNPLWKHEWLTAAD